MNARQIEDVIIALLAEQWGRQPDDLRRELEALGPEMPIDSLLAAEILARVEAQLGVSLPATAETARSLKSVGTFAQALLELISGESEGTKSA